MATEIAAENLDSVEIDEAGMLNSPQRKDFKRDVHSPMRNSKVGNPNQKVGWNYTVIRLPKKRSFEINDIIKE